MADFKDIELQFGVDFEYSVDDGVNWLAGTSNTVYTVAPESNGNGKVKVRSANSVTSIPARNINKSSIKEINIKNGSSLTSLAYTFNGFSSLEGIRLKDCDNVTSLLRAFSGTVSLDSNKVHFDTSFTNLTNTSSCFDSSGITHAPNIDLTKVTNASSMYVNSKIKSIANLNLPVATTIGNMLDGTDVEIVGSMNCPIASSPSSLFYNCKKLEFIGETNLNKVTSMYRVVVNAEKLKIFGLKINRVEANYQDSNINSSDSYQGCHNLISPYKEIQTKSSIINQNMFNNIESDAPVNYPSQEEIDGLGVDQTYLSDHSVDWIPYITEMYRKNNINLVGSISINSAGGTYYRIKNNEYIRGKTGSPISSTSFDYNQPITTAFGTKKVTFYDNGTKSITYNNSDLETFSDIIGTTSVATATTSSVIKSICINDAEDAVYVLLGSINLDKTNNSSFNQEIKKYSLPSLTLDAGFGTKTITNDPLNENIYLQLSSDSSQLKLISNQFSIGATQLEKTRTVVKYYSDYDLSILRDTFHMDDIYDVFFENHIVKRMIVMLNSTSGDTFEIILPDRD